MTLIQRGVALLATGLIAMGTAEGSSEGRSTHQRGTLIVEVHGAGAKGSLRFALDPAAKTFLQDQSDHPEWRTLAAPAGQDAVRIEVANVAFGTYALRGFYDANDNGKLDTNLLGIPAEAYGFSNGARRWFGPPKFADAAFTFSSDQQVVTVVLSPHIKTLSVGTGVPEETTPAAAPSRG